MPGVAPTDWTEIPRSETHEVPLDTQTREWVESTGHRLVDPGQLGIHTTWHDGEMTLKCITLGLVVLYEEIDEDGEPEQEG